MTESTRNLICGALRIGGRGMTVSQICAAISPPGEPPANKNTITKILRDWLDERVVVRTGFVPLPHGGKEGVFARVGEPKPKPQRANPVESNWTPPCRYPSVFHFARGRPL